jgi:hypothetical protein
MQSSPSQQSARVAQVPSIAVHAQTPARHSRFGQQAADALQGLPFAAQAQTPSPAQLTPPQHGELAEQVVEGAEQGKHAPCTQPSPVQQSWSVWQPRPCEWQVLLHRRSSQRKPEQHPPVVADTEHEPP